MKPEHEIVSRSVNYLSYFFMKSAADLLSKDRNVMTGSVRVDSESLYIEWRERIIIPTNGRYLRCLFN